MKPHIKTLPCFPQVAAVIGESRAQIELWKVVHGNPKSPSTWDPESSKPWTHFKDLSLAFYWEKTPQGKSFWQSICYGINPYHD